MKGGGSDFSLKKGGVGKIGGVVLKKGVITYFHTYYSFPVLSFFECLVCVCVCVCLCVCVCVVSIGIICVSQEEPSLIASNQRIYDFYK